MEKPFQRTPAGPGARRPGFVDPLRHSRHAAELLACVVAAQSNAIRQDRAPPLLSPSAGEVLARAALCKSIDEVDWARSKLEVHGLLKEHALLKECAQQAEPPDAAE